MIEQILRKLRTINPWHFIWIIILIAEAFTLILNSLQSFMRWGYISRELIEIGTIDALVVSLIAAPVVIYSLKAANEKLKQDLTERKKTEEKLMSITKAVESTSDAIGISDSLGHHFYQNKALSDLFEYTTAEELEAAGGGPAVVKDPQVAEEMFDTIMSGKSWAGELEMVTKSGRVFTAFDRADAIKDNEGNLIGLIGIITDLTERKQTEKKLAERNQFIESIINLSPDILYIYDLIAQKNIYSNDGIQRILGYSAKEILQMGNQLLGTLMHPDDLGTYFRETWPKYAEVKDNELILHQYRIKHKNGQWYWLDCKELIYKRQTDGSPSQILGVVHDITEIKNIRDRLEEKTAEQNAILENTLAGIAFLKDRRFIWVNSKMEEMFGYQRDEVSGLTTEVFYPSQESYEQLGKEAYPLLAGGQTYSSERLMKRKDGSVFWCSLSGKAIDPSAVSKGSIWILQDITERKKAEEAKDRLLNAISAATEGIAITDDKDRFIYVNDAHARIYGCLQDELIGKTWRDTVTPELGPLIERDLSKTLHNRAVGIWSGECPALRKDGTLLPAEITATSRWDETDNYLGHICIVRDITERKLADEQILSALKEKEILLKEVHHRVKNNLQVVASMLHLQAGYIKDREARILFEESQMRVESMALLHEKLYQAKDLARIDFREYVVDLAGNLLTLNTDKSERIEMNLHIEGVILDVNNSIPCGLIINELVSNALAHAFPDGRKGKIDISMRSGNERKIAFSVSDNGIGFPEDIDFRNTASLGMQLVNSLVNQLGGLIELDRSEGTSFTIEFQA